MKTIVFYRTETTGFPVYGSPSRGDDQPHLVKICAVKCNADSPDIIDTLDLTIKPDGWEIPEVTTVVHGISNELALEVGISEADAIEKFVKFYADSDLVTFNKNFHARIIRIALKRYRGEDTIDAWAEKEGHFCASVLAKPLVKIPLKSKKGFRNPSLEEAFSFFTGVDLEKTDSSLTHAAACKTVYFSTLSKKDAS